MDEIDAVGRHRGAGLGGGHDEREQTLNQLLVEMDGFETNEGVILIAATNRPDVLDPALLRPGRFDRQVVVPRPDVKGREEILRVHARRIPLGPDVDLKVLARGTPGFSGADLANLVNEAALLAARHSKKLVEMFDFESAKDKVLMGVERRSMIISEEEKRTIAYHEAGHTLVAHVLPGADPVHKVTIIPRGRALGTDPAAARGRQVQLLARLPHKPHHHSPRRPGGRGDGAPAADHRRRRRSGEGDRDGPQDGLRVGHVREAGPPDLRQAGGAHLPGREFARQQDYSEETAVLIDAEVKQIIVDSAARARSILEEQIARLHRLAKALLEHESLDAEEITRVLAVEPHGALEGAPA